jgi:hypothetical protein
MHQIMVGNTWEFHQIPLNDVVYLLLDQLDSVKKKKLRNNKTFIVNLFYAFLQHV